METATLAPVPSRPPALQSQPLPMALGDESLEMESDEAPDGFPVELVAPVDVDDGQTNETNKSTSPLTNNLMGAAIVALTLNADAKEAAEEVERAAGGARRKNFRIFSMARKIEAQNASTSQHLDNRSWATGQLMSPHVWWRHPIARLLLPWLVLLQDLYIFGEDPLNDSHVHANYPGMGHVMGIVTFWAAPTFALGLLRLAFTIISLALGLKIGRWFARTVLFRWCGISAFDGDEGQLMTVPLAMCLLLAVFAFLLDTVTDDTIDGASMELFYALGAPNLEYRTVAKYFQVLSLSIDFLAIVMISDQIMQDWYHYPEWAKLPKQWWTKQGNGWARIVLTWMFVLAVIIVSAVCVFLTGKEEGDIRWNDTTLGGTTEVTRSLLATFIIFSDLLTTAQDWDFPTFREPIEVGASTLIAGTNLESLVIKLPEGCTRSIRAVTARIDCGILGQWLPSLDSFSMRIRGKWLAYGPLLGVMVVDLLCAKTQVLYSPEYYGQYTSPDDGRIWAIVDLDYLTLAYDDRGNPVDEILSLVSYEARRDLLTGEPLDASAATDVELNGKYVENFAVSSGFFGLSLALIVLFGLILKFADWRRARIIDEVRRQLAIQTTLTCRAEVGDTELAVESEGGFAVGDVVEVKGASDGENEKATIASVDPKTIRIEAPLKYGHCMNAIVSKVMVSVPPMVGVQPTMSENSEMGSEMHTLSERPEQMPQAQPNPGTPKSGHDEMSGEVHARNEVLEQAPKAQQTPPAGHSDSDLSVHSV